MDRTLYHKIADQVESQIREGLFKVGSKIPSIRKASIMLDVSMATVLQAYRVLEDRGVIKAQPQKGYFVQTLPMALDRAPMPTVHHNRQSLLNELSAAAQMPDLIQLASSHPHSQFLPIRQLQRSVGRMMRLEPDLCSAQMAPSGLPALRRQIAIRMLDTGCQLTPEEILITLGCQNALTLALQALTQPGDYIAIESPTYDGVYQAAFALQLQVIEIPCTPQGMDLTQLERHCQERAIRACIVTPEHQNPTSACMPLAQRQTLLALAKQHDMMLIEDDVYGELGYKSARREPSLKALDQEGDVVYCSSFSKTIAPAFRVGWIVPGRHFAAIEHLSYVHNLAVPSLTQQAIVNFLESGSYDRHLRKTRTFYAENAVLFQTAIARYFPPTTQTSKPQGGFLLWVTLPNKINSLALHKQALKAKVNLLPGAVLSASGGHTYHLRLNYAYPWSNETDAALRKIGELCFAMLD